MIIMHIGRWNSEAFLEYIRKQVESFTLGISGKMIKYENFHNLNAVQQRESVCKNAFVEEDNVSVSDRISIEHEVRLLELSLGV